MKRRELNGGDLILQGEDVSLLEIAVDGKPLSSSQYSVSSEALTVFESALPNEVPFLETISKIEINIISFPCSSLS